MNILSTIWNALNGKKRTIALIYWAVLTPSLLVIWPNGFPEGFPLIVYKTSTIFGFLLGALGLGHAAAKNMSVSSDVEEEQQTKQFVPPDKIEGSKE